MPKQFNIHRQTSYNNPIKTTTNETFPESECVERMNACMEGHLRYSMVCDLKFKYKTG